MDAGINTFLWMNIWIDSHKDGLMYFFLYIDGYILTKVDGWVDTRIGGKGRFFFLYERKGGWTEYWAKGRYSMSRRMPGQEDQLDFMARWMSG